MKKENEELISRDVRRVKKGSPFLDLILDKYLDAMKECLDEKDLSYRLEVVIETDNRKIKPVWTPVVYIVTEKQLEERAMSVLASELRNKLDEELMKFRETLINQEKLEIWARRIEYGIGTEEEIYGKSD